MEVKMSASQIHTLTVSMNLFFLFFFGGIYVEEGRF